MRKPTDKLYSGELRNGKLTSSSVSSAPPAVYMMGSAFEPKSALASVAIPPATPKLDELLEAHLKDAEAAKATSQQVEVIVTYKETLKLPRFPALSSSEPRGSLGNQAVLQRADQLAGQIVQARAPEHAAHAADLAARWEYGHAITSTL